MNCPLCEDDAKLPFRDPLHKTAKEVKPGTLKCEKCGREVCDKHSLIISKDPKKYICLNCI